ncbi:MAG TPA: hypothetical protein VGI79_13730 [Caulobacteraceae bacterium]
MSTSRESRGLTFRNVDSDTGWRLAGMALLVALITAATFLHNDHQVARTLGDTDDAMRLVQVRDLLGGRGWYDQVVTRLQPPAGTVMHWSRLLDGALAGVLWLARLGLSPSEAERAVRIGWPLALILPAAAASLSIAGSLGGRRAVLAGGLLLIANPWVFVQFQPGRIDHHNVQITMTLAAAAFSVTGGGRFWSAVLAGAASALALAIGIESLAFQALIGLGWGLALAQDPRLAQGARGYGLALALMTGGLFLIQTPPGRWSLSVCDTLGWNLTAAIILAGLGLAAVASLRPRCGVQIGLLLTVGMVAAALYLALDPACLHGPFAAVDPRLRPFWFDGIEELKPWPALLRDNRAAAVRILAVSLMGIGGAGLLVWRVAGRPNARLLTAIACLLVAVAVTFQAFRMEDYAFGFGLPVLAAAIAMLTEGWGLAALVATTLAASPASLGGAINWALARLAPAPPPTAAPNSRCYDDDVYRPLAMRPPGLVLADINLGPFILAHTGDSVLAAPYHRMSWGILAAHQALGAPVDQAEQRVRALGVRYIVGCGALTRAGPGSFEAELWRGRIPPWLQPVSSAGDVLQIYQVEPLAQPLKEP